MDTHAARSLAFLAVLCLAGPVLAQNGEAPESPEGTQPPADAKVPTAAEARAAIDAKAKRDAATQAEKQSAKEQISSPAERATSVCIDKEIADRLAVKRKRRGVVDRLYVKQNRHEFALNGGYYVSDLFSATYVAGGSYTYHMTEATALEFSFAWTHQDADTIRAIESGRGTVLEDDFARALFYEAILNITPFYGKLRLGGQVMRYDVHIDLGVGGIDSPTAGDLVGVGGVGVKLFLGQPVALRFDIRDRVYSQEILDEKFIVNDLALTAGISVFFPFRN